MTQLRRALTTFDLTMIAIGGTIGSGIFLTPSLVAQNLPSPYLIVGAWTLGGVMALAGALTFAELGSMLPRAGGMYVYLSEAYGSLVAFLFGWAYFVVVNTGGIAALSIAFASYFGFFIPLDSAGTQLTAIIGLAVITLLNVFGVKIGGIFSDVFTILKLAAIAGLILVGLGWGSAGTSNFASAPGDLPDGLAGALALAMVGVLWSYGGWQHATFIAGEAKDPGRSVSRAMILGTTVVILVYVLTNLAYLFLLPLSGIASSPRVASDAVAVILGTAGGSTIAAAIFVSTFGTTGIYTLTAPRIYYAMAIDGLFFRRVAEVHTRFHTPAFSILLQSLWAMVLILFWGTFENLISYVVFTDWIFFGLTGACVFVLRRKKPAAERPYRTPGYPVTPAIFVGIAAWFVVNTLLQKPAQAWAGLAFLGAGVPIYFFWKKKLTSTDLKQKV